ncbi:hypothetical protein [Dyadobacter sp. CY343]|uniref:hypothetical protein n=1 Tax=Dyadobacter sp. CY343 TaxID=2907299 RepID=UPI001F3045B4|nr:hypothetical protein [Dyadobacter sp. CY343]MCE7059854.1 hypothetical protein [Dyadobacter sp. CY343]
MKHLYPKSAGRLALLVLILYAQFAVAQPSDAVYATETPVPGTDGGSVTNPENAANSSRTSAAELVASKAVLGGATSCSLQLIFTNSVNYESANPKTVYFKSIQIPVLLPTALSRSLRKIVLVDRSA